MSKRNVEPSKTKEKDFSKKGRQTIFTVGTQFPVEVRGGKSISGGVDSRTPLKT